MARKLRIQYGGEIYHVMNRGDRREAIFADDEDRQRFFQTLGKACQKTSWQVQAYCLMTHHFQLVVATPQANLVAGMKWFVGISPSRYRGWHQEFGHLFMNNWNLSGANISGPTSNKVNEFPVWHEIYTNTF
jgi:REP element-mobilizing transposase RayT